MRARLVSNGRGSLKSFLEFVSHPRYIVCFKKINIKEIETVSLFYLVVSLSEGWLMENLSAAFLRNGLYPTSFKIFFIFY